MSDDRSRRINEAVRRVFGRRAAFYRTSPAHTDPAVLNRLVELAAPEPETVALDLGTGAGHTAAALAPHLRSVVGLDLTPQMLAQVGQDRGSTIRLCLGDAHGLPFGGASFDLVTCRRAAHHFADLRRAMAEAHRVLRPRGRLIVDDRSVPEDPRVDRLMNRLDRLHDPSHVRQAPPSEWIALLEQVGFSVETVEPYRRLRPLADLQPEGDPAAAAAIGDIVASLPDDLARAAGRASVNGGWHLTHWFVMLAAIRR